MQHYIAIYRWMEATLMPCWGKIACMAMSPVVKCSWGQPVLRSMFYFYSIIIINWCIITFTHVLSKICCESVRISMQISQRSFEFLLFSDTITHEWNFHKKSNLKGSRQFVSFLSNGKIPQKWWQQTMLEVTVAGVSRASPVVFVHPYTMRCLRLLPFTLFPEWHTHT